MASLAGFARLAEVDKVASPTAYGLEKPREARVRLSRYFVVLAAVWMVAMTWRIYPQFGDTLRIDGRLMGYAEYVEGSCGQRIGPAAASCLAEARDTGRRLVAQEQGKSVLLIEAPILGYLLLYLPARVFVDWIGGRGRGRRGEPGRVESCNGRGSG